MSDLFNETRSKVRIAEFLGVDVPKDEAVKIETLFPAPFAPIEVEMRTEELAKLLKEGGVKLYRPKMLSLLQEFDTRKTLGPNSRFNGFLTQQEIIKQERKQLRRVDPANEMLGREIYEGMSKHQIEDEEARIAETKYIKEFSIRLPGGANERIVSYYPKHKAYPYDGKLLSQVFYIGITQDYVSLFPHNLVKVIEEYSYGTGSWAGQAQRLSDMATIRHGRNGKNKPKGLNIQVPIKTTGMPKPNWLKEKTQEVDRGATIPPRERIKGVRRLDIHTMCNILDITLPISEPEEDQPPLRYAPDGNFFPSPEDDMDNIEEPVLEDFLPPITRRSASGLPFLGETKGETTKEAIAISTLFLRGIAQILKNKGKKDEKSIHAEYTKVMNDFWYTNTGVVFPKNERYSRDKWYTKTRNIWSAPYPTHLLLSMASHPIMRMSNINATNFDTPSLQKFNPFTGMDAVVEMVLAATGPIDFIYADNWYILYPNETGDHDWFSLDLEKGEANATPEDAQALAYYLLTRGWSIDGQPNFNATWAFFLLNIAPHLIVDAVGLLQNLQFKMPGQGSGNAWTFLINHLITSKLRWVWELFNPKGDLPPSPDSPEFQEVARLAGVNIKVESVVRSVKERLKTLKDIVPMDGYLQHLGDDRPPHTDTPTVPLDLLGFSTTYSRVLKKYIAVLDYQRLCQSAAYPKGQPPDKDAIAHKAYSIVRMEALRAIGGWAYPVLDRACENIAINNRDTIQRAGLDLSKYIVDWKGSEFADILASDETGVTVDLSHRMTVDSLMDLHRDRPLAVPHPVVRPLFPAQLGKAARLAFTTTMTPKSDAERTLADKLCTVAMQNSLGTVLKEYKEAATSSLKMKLKKKNFSALQEILNITSAMSQDYDFALDSKLKRQTATVAQASNPVVAYRLPRPELPTGDFDSSQRQAPSILRKSLFAQDDPDYLEPRFQTQKRTTKTQKKNRKMRERARAGPSSEA
nr:MAG: RNA-dependent RNA polymerase [South China Sea birna-like virus]